jgi:hypothetical protein
MDEKLYNNPNQGINTMVRAAEKAKIPAHAKTNLKTLLSGPFFAALRLE